jgi:DNA replication protein DnaC
MSAAPATSTDGDQQCSPILLTSQVPIDRWHDIVGNPTLADAILDRIVHNAYKIELAGESMRKRRTLESSA